MAQEDLAVTLLRRLGTLKGARSPHEDTWRDCYDHSYPIRGQGFYGETEDINSVQNKRARLYDATSTDASNTLASGIQSGMTPANSQWFGLQTWNQSDDEKKWFSDSATKLWEAIHASNFDAVSLECCQDITAAGWFVLFIDEAKNDDGSVDGLHFQQFPISECYLAASKPGGRCDTLFRPYCLTVEQTVQEFGLAKVSAKVRELYQDEKYDEKVELLHAVYPRRLSAVGSRRAKSMPFASVHVECNDKNVVRESGYQEQPFVAPRWSLIPKSVYAIGPMFDALPDTKTLNYLVKMEEAGVDIAVAGMWIAEDDGVLNPRTVKVGPRKIIVANSVDSMKPLTTGANFQVSFSKKEQLQAAIRKTLMADQLQPQDGPAMTATEVNVRVALIRQLLGPRYGRLQAEYLQVLIERCFGLALRGGLFAPMPESLLDRSFHIVYQSPMAKAQKLEEVNAIETTLVSAGQLAAAQGSPEAWDNFDVDGSLVEIADGRGMPARLVRSPEDVAKIRKKRAEDMQAAQEQAQQQQLTQVAGEAAVNRIAEAA